MDWISDEFDRALTWTGSIRAVCSCGRTTFASGSQALGYEDGELEELQQRATDDPDRYREDPSSDGIGIAHLGGREYVWECPCGQLPTIEAFLWGNRKAIVDYYKRRASSEKKAADSFAASLEA